MSKKTKISDCPKELSDLIELINLLPDTPEERRAFEDRLCSLQEKALKQWDKIMLVRDTDERFTQQELDEYDQRVKRIYEWFYKNFVNSKELKLAQSLGITTPINTKFQITKLYNEKTTLLETIQAFRTWDKAYNRQIVPPVDFNLSRGIVAFGFNEDTTIQSTSFRVWEILVKNKIPIERLGICPICTNIFYAKRTDAKTCGLKKCVETQGNRSRARKNEEEK